MENNKYKVVYGCGGFEIDYRPARTLEEAKDIALNMIADLVAEAQDWDWDEEPTQDQIEAFNEMVTNSGVEIRELDPGTGRYELIDALDEEELAEAGWAVIDEEEMEW